MKKYIKLMRVHHYIKNLLVFAPLIFSMNLLNIKLLVPSLFGFIAFCLISSLVYIINDIKDVEKDKLHPTKCNRPIASGAVKIPVACGIAAVLFVLAMLFNYLAGFSLDSMAYLLTYLMLNIAYSFGFKDKPIIDIAILSSGFLLRVLYGSAVTEIEVSNWLYLTVISAAFYFSLGKRRNEVKKLGDDSNTRNVLKFYSKEFLDKNMYVFLALVNVFYALWSMDVDSNSTIPLVWTVPIVMLICMKYSLSIENDSDGDPVEVLLHDKTLIILCLIYACAMFVMLYN